jgi:hypothetical protein
MSDTKHTPGPWEAEPHRLDKGRWVICSSASESPAGLVRIAESEAYDHPQYCEEGAANARLIAAAPDLLAACELVYHAHCTSGIPQRTKDEALRKCWEALTKARES